MFDQKQPIQAPRITPDIIRNSPTIECEECGGKLFTEKLMFKKISALISPTGKEEVVPMPLLVCEKCGKVPAVFDTNNVVPEELKALKKTFTGMRVEK
jgi:hypothetical protein